MEPWRHAAASVRGTAHLKDGRPCQDYAQVETILASGQPRTLIAAAADGAGSAARSDQGARAACQAFLEFSRMALEWIVGADRLPPDFAADALLDLQREVHRLAFAQAEPASSYACTLLGALVTDDAALFVQLGDGAIVYRTFAEPAWRLAAEAQRGEFANETVFVTRGDAAKYLKAVLVRDAVAEFAIMTDGVEFLAVKQQTGEPHPAFFEHVLKGLRHSAEPGHSAWIERFLASDAVSQRTDDDKTLIVASRIPCPPRS